MATAVKLLLLANAIFMSKETIISKSFKEECIAESDVKNRNSSICKSKLVVSLTVTANEVQH